MAASDAPVVGTRRAALGDPAGRHVSDDLLDGVGVGLHRGGAGHVTDGAVAHQRLEQLFAVRGGVTSVTAISMPSRRNTWRRCA